jgi:hypothetical protein
MYIDQSKTRMHVWPWVIFLIEMELNILTIITAMFFYSRGVDCVKNVRTAGAK